MHINILTLGTWVNPKITSSFQMRMTPGFISNDIKPDILLISDEEDIRYYVNKKSMLLNSK